MPAKEAHELGIKTLYRYERYPKGDPQKRSWVDALLTQGELYLRRAEEFNDPFECRPHFVPMDVDPVKAHEGQLRRLRELLTASGNTADEITAIEKGLTPQAFETQREEMELRWRLQLGHDYPMCCFAADADSIPMWSHYGDSHAGVLLHFDATRTPIGNAREVVYETEYPKVPVPPTQEPEEIARRCLLWKSREWEYEREFRLIDYPAHPDSDVTRVLDAVLTRKSDQIVILPPSMITAVTLGMRIDSELKLHLITLARRRKPELQVWQAGLERAKYKMTFARIA